jgi:hypothetical protein
VLQTQKKPTKHVKCGATGTLLHGVSVCELGRQPALMRAPGRPGATCNVSSDHRRNCSTCSRSRAPGRAPGASRARMLLHAPPGGGAGRRTLDSTAGTQQAG